MTTKVASSMISQPVTSGTSVATTSGTTKDFTGIPSWVTEISIMFVGVSTNGTDPLLVQIGDAGGIETSGYLSGSSACLNAAATAGVNSTAGFVISSASASNILHGSMTLRLADAATFTWASTHSMGRSNDAAAVHGGGSKSTSAVLTQLRITTTGGVNTFDAGLVNIRYS